MTPRHRLRLARLIVEDSWPISRAVAAFRYRGRVEGRRNRAATPGKPRNRHHNPILGTAFVHTVLDDHSRVAYAEVHDDETAATAIGVLRRAVSWFAARGVAVERVLSDNGPAYRSRAWRDSCQALCIKPCRTRPYRPQTNWLHEYSHHRPHTATGRRPPISRLTNLSGQCS